MTETAVTAPATRALSPPHRSHLLVGHDRAMATFAGAMRNGRMPHAWMFCGPAGIGKATLAFRLARYLLEPGSASRLDPGRFECSHETGTARRIAARAHPDLLVIERPPIKADEDKSPDENHRKAAEITIDTVRRIPPFLHRTPAEGGWRVVIVDEADCLNRNAANAILKVIEEPPRQAIVFLICSRPGAMLPTIRSRCRRLTLSPLDPNDVASMLMNAGLENDLSRAAVIGRLSAGSPGKAIDLLEADAVALFTRLISLIGGGARLDLKSASDLADSVSRPTAEKAYRAFQHLTFYLVSRILKTAATGDHALQCLEGEDAVIQRATRAGLDPWLEVWEKMGRLFASADRVHLDRRQIAVNVVMMLDDIIRRT